MDRFASTGAPAGGASPVRRGWPAVWFLALMVLALCGGTWPAGTHAAASGPGPAASPSWTPAPPAPGRTFGVGETGPTGPVFSGPHQQPFLCETEASGLGKPLVDNYDGIGMAVYDDDGGLLGYSRYCSVPTRIYYVYRSTDGTFKPLPDRAARPPDLAQTTTSDGLTVDYIVQVEVGTINRFIYAIAMLAPYDGARYNPFIPQPWNGRLLYYFGGGVGIGNRQGRLRERDFLFDEVLSKGWAVAHSTGNVTSHQYNLVLAGETAMMVKDHFTARYGKPMHTIGVGASGGAIQQYIISQNHPGLLDGIVPIDSYPEMITQSIYVGDCELMEYLFDTSDDPRWRSPVAREVFEGLAGNEVMGVTACASAWRGLTQLAINPTAQKPDLVEALLRHFPAEVVMTTPYSHWNDLRNIYGVDRHGIAPNTWDNVGVQYGLKSLQHGVISKEDFFWMNEVIGGWAPPHEMTTASLPYDAENQRRGEPGRPSRTEGDIGAMQKAYLSGHVFTGHVEVPMIDARFYKDDLLDMHHFLQSFAARARIERVHGHSDHQVIWVAHPDSGVNVYWDAVFAMDEWLTNMRADPHLSIVEARPEHVVDKCWDADGNVIAAGAGVWAEGSGIGWRGPGAGPCRQAFPTYENSRTLAGMPVSGDVFKCRLMSVDEAAARGLYPTEGPNSFTDRDFARLREIFPDGVCDYTLPDAGLPPGWVW